MTAQQVGSGSGLRAVVVDGGGLASLGTGSIELVQHAASALEPGLLQLWVRDRAAGTCHPLLGAGSGSLATAGDGELTVTGGEQGVDGGGLRWRATLALHPEQLAWAWHVEVSNDGPGPREIDVVHAHDVALAAPGALHANELYISQYLDVSPLDGPTGTALAVRQNLPQAGTHPWCVLAADPAVTSWATDALDVHGRTGRSGRGTGPVGDLPGRRWQHEHTLATLQTRTATLARGDLLDVTFAGLLLEDHPGATSPDDVALVERALALARETRSASRDGGDPAARSAAPAPSGPYDQGRELRSGPLGPDELRDRWPEPWQVVERDEGGELLSFFAGDEHVVTQAKELDVLRPHGTLLRTGDRAAPDAHSLTVTAWMAGSPLSYLTRGHATTGRVLTTVRGYLGMHRAYGLRVLVEVDGRWRLLDLPSAFAMTPDSARWVHVVAPSGGDVGGTVEMRTVLPAGGHHAELQVDVVGPPRRVLVALHLATEQDPLPAAADAVRTSPTTEGVVVHVRGPGDLEQALEVRATAPVEVGDDSPLFDDGVHRTDAVVTLLTPPVQALGLRLSLGAAPDGDMDSQWWREVTSIRVAGDGEGVDTLAVSLPWLVRDAFVHHLAPRGLEQYTGGAWGTRDVTQGPLELLLALDRLEDARRLLLSVFAAQNLDGSWPQAFGFLPGDEHFRHEPPHGDVVHWPVLALGRYLLASADGTVLDEQVPWYTPAASGEPTAGGATTLADHVDRALACARAGMLPGTHLVAYGHGDWNDSLQPADPAMARTMASAWTVTLHHQSLRTLAEGLTAAGRPAGAPATLHVEALRTEAEAIAGDLHRHLLVDGELAGYVQLGEPEGAHVPVLRHLVHPRDSATGLRHGALQIVHALGDDLLSPEQARHHVALVREHLMGVDGVRLFDRPPGYHGGETRHFQRAETATFVGREIGLMYVHAHLRWCEAMARWGDPEALWLGVRQVLAPGVLDVVPGARRRQANTYASSSDAAVLDRDDFSARYAEVLTGATGLEGGWRVYSSGPGVLVRILTQSLLGVRRRGGQVEIDPVLPRALDGLTASVPLAGGHLRLRYRVGPGGSGVTSLRLGDRVLTGPRTANPYRAGGTVLDLADLAATLRGDAPELEVHLP
ncbi:cellobiose phosphorylase [Actinotalea sp. K2]|uniref:cellobiose phosphorylase n=1 Tax=Actinotalea sp. K2 TaxID=2939438 RepID=UPI002016FA95|nr:cellobiose phosphorylase [Actinotalea sp. K2]MCL3861237.1 cellobiose phosphorylase [Actinotalea sp. K2]